MTYLTDLGFKVGDEFEIMATACTTVQAVISQGE